MATAPRIAGAVLAAGRGLRMGGVSKATLVIRGQRLVDRAVHALTAAGCDPVVAVVPTGTAVDGARVVVNDAPERGMRSSLELAVDATDENIGALVVLLVDMPGIGADAVRAVIDHWRPDRIAVGRFDATRRGHPVVMSPDLWRAAIAQAGEDEGARQFLADHPELVDEVAIAADPTDLDTAADMENWERS